MATAAQQTQPARRRPGLALAPAPAAGAHRTARPHRHDGTARLFFVDVDPRALARSCPPGLALAPGFRAQAAILLAGHDQVRPLGGPAQACTEARELLVAAVVVEPGVGRPQGVFPLVSCADSAPMRSGGREAHGLHIDPAELTLGPEGAEVSLRASARGRASTPLLRASWRRGEAASGPTAALAAIGVELIASLLEGQGGLIFYSPEPGPSLLRVPARDISIGPPTRLHEARFEPHPGALRSLLPPGQQALVAPAGFEFRLGFTLGAPRG